MNIKSWFGLGVVTILFLASGACSRNPEVTRTVSGFTPLAKGTIHTEEFCNSLAVPPGSILLETRILSKRESGVVTKKYSMEMSCQEVNSFFREKLIPENWKIVDSYYDEMFSMVYKTDEHFQLEDKEIEIMCSDIRSIYGTKTYYISCAWH